MSNLAENRQFVSQCRDASSGDVDATIVRSRPLHCHAHSTVTVTAMKDAPIGPRSEQLPMIDSKVIHPEQPVFVQRQPFDTLYRILHGISFDAVENLASSA